MARIFFNPKGEPLRRRDDIYRHILTKAQKKQRKRDRQRGRKKEAAK